MTKAAERKLFFLLRSLHCHSSYVVRDTQSGQQVQVGNWDRAGQLLVYTVQQAQQ